MYFEKTNFRDLEKVCIQKYGQDEGKLIFEEAEKLLKQYLEKADYRNSEAVKWHMMQNIFPILAYYKALLLNGMSKEEAYKDVLDQTQRQALVKKLQNKRLSHLPGFYHIFRIGVKRVMSKQYPEAGWETKWVTNNAKKVEFHLKRCVYYETVTAYGCPELCTVFCKNDVTAFSGYMPKIAFKRNGTIAEGKKMCDFHFIKQ